jgi:hypothetical protein
MRLICYFVIITRSNIIKAAFKLTKHFINSDLKHLKKAVDHCIKYLHVIKFLIIRYSNSKDEKLNNQISSSNQEMSSTSNSKLNRKTWSNQEKKDKQIFESTANVFLRMILIEKTLKNTFLNYSIKWSTELQKNNSLSRRSSSKRNFFWCCMLTKS